MPIAFLLPMLLPALAIVVALYRDSRGRFAPVRVRSRGRDERLRRLLRGDE
jgi:hypothetical protein